MEVSIASDVYQGTYQYDELVDMQFVENAQKTKLKRVFSRIECMQISGAFLRCRGICHSQHTDTPFPPNL